MNLYQLHTNPESLYKYSEAPYKILSMAYEHALKRYEETGQRDPELERVIALDSKSWKEYINELSMTANRFALSKYLNTRQRDPELERVIAQSPRWAYNYALNIIRKRVPELESVIAQDPVYAMSYAKNVIKDRWPEAEEVIKQDPRSWNRYNLYFRIK